MKNLLMLVIDGLSKWYIDHAPEDAAFFQSIHKYGYSAENMFSCAPFTQGAIGNFWYGKDIFDGWGYLQENCYSGKSIFDIFHDQSYEIYIGRLPPFYSGKMHATVHLPGRENPVPRALDHLWRGRISYYLNIGIDNLSENDWLTIRYLLKTFFETYREYSLILEEEYREFIKNEKKYTYDVIVDREEGRFFRSMDTSMYEDNFLKFIAEQKKAVKNELCESELVFCRKMRLKNRSRMLEINKEQYSPSELEPILAVPMNRCMISNDDISSHLRNGYENLPGIGEELEEFYSWYQDRNTGKHFFAYIHNFDFHYPEVFINHRFGDEAYDGEIVKITKYLNDMKSCPMSISKQLALRNIDKNVEMFVQKLKESHFFEDSTFIITADHGISNYMYPVRRKSTERWNYIKTNFQIPFYVMGTKYVGKDEGLHTAKEIFSLLEKRLDNQEEPNTLLANKNAYISTNWVNGVPDLTRAKIRYGVRNLDMSMTIESYASQFLLSSDVTGLYHLREDPNELYNVYKEKTREVLNLFRLLFPQWEMILQQFVLGDGDCKVFKSDWSDLLQKHLRFILEYNRKLDLLEKNMYFNSCSNEVIVCGDGKGVFDFVETLPSSVHVTKIVGTSFGKKYMCGIPYQSIEMMEKDENCGIVIADRKEIEYVALLREFGFYNFIISSMLV